MENFKKLALMGMAGGMLLASQTPVHADGGDAVITLAGGCGGGKCGGGQSSKNYTADASDSIQTRSHGCGGRASSPQPAYQQQGCNGAAPQPTIVQQGCQARSYPQQPSQPNYSQQGCSSASQPRYSGAAYQQPSQHGCGGMSSRIADAAQTAQTRVLSENELLQQLDSNGKAAYQRLSPEGKALALKLAGQNTFNDKNEAVKAAEAASRNGSLPKSSY